MSDERLRELEREVRAGDDGARLLLTAELVRARKGFLVAWDADYKPFRSKRGARRWVERRHVVPLMVDQFTPRADGKPRVRPIKQRRWAIAILDLEDLYRMVSPSADDPFEILDLGTGCAEFAPEDVYHPSSARRARRVGRGRQRRNPLVSGISDMFRQSLLERSLEILSSFGTITTTLPNPRR